MATASKKSQSEVFVIGGAATYAEFAPFVDRYLVTIVDHVSQEADAFLAPCILEELQTWSSVEIGRYPVVEGRDEFPFQIVEYKAPDAEARRASRERLISGHLSKMLNQKTKAKQSKQPFSQVVNQANFAF